MLGHYSSGFTLDIYTHVTDKMQQEAAEKIGGFMEMTLRSTPSVLYSSVQPVMGQIMGHLMGQKNQPPSKVTKTRRNHRISASFWSE